MNASVGQNMSVKVGETSKFGCKSISSTLLRALSVCIYGNQKVNIKSKKMSPL